MTQIGYGALRLLVDPPGDAEANMERDEQIAAQVCGGLSPSVLRLYGWVRPAISLGRRQKVEELPPELRQSKRTIVWRPTGGGAVLHDADDFTYAVALPRSAFMGRLKALELPVWIHRQLKEQWVERGLVSSDDLVCSSGDSGGSSSFCFESPVCGDLLYRNRKVAGSALRVWRGGLLIQGSIQGLPVGREALAECLESACRQLLPSGS